MSSLKKKATKVGYGACFKAFFMYMFQIGTIGHDKLNAVYPDQVVRYIPAGLAAWVDRENFCSFISCKLVLMKL